MAEKLLSDRQLRSARPKAKEYLLADGGSLYARVRAMSSGAAAIAWQYYFKWQGKTERMSLGAHPAVSLAEARRRRDEARALLKAEPPVHPVIEQKRRAAEARAKAVAEALDKTVRGLFDDWQRVYLAQHRKDGGREARAFFERDVFPLVGNVRARAVARADITAIIDRMLARGVRRKTNAVLALLKQMFAHGVVRGLVDQDPTYGWKAAHAGGKMPSRERALTVEELGELARKLPASGLADPYQAAVRILLATGARVGELNRARWPELDLAARTWLIPAANAKNGREHRVHLSEFALEALGMLARYREGAYLMPSRKRDAPIDAKAIAKALRDRQRVQALPGRSKRDLGALALSGGAWSPHDLRRTFATRLGDLGVLPHVVERALNHTMQGVMAVYNRQDYAAERRSALEAWGAELARMFAAVPATGAQVLALPRARSERKRTLG